ncbi:outer membrane protein transport protein [bacterium]|nr:outer membrane protein transport protein [bacterium]
MKGMRRVTTTLAIAALFLFAGSAFAGGYNLAGVGAKALGMSGAFRGISDDWSAMYWNPAGLAGQDNTLYLEVKSLYPVVWVTPEVPNQVEGYEFYRNGTEISTREAAFPAGAFAAVYKVNDKMTAGLAIFAPTAIGTKWEHLTTGTPYGYNNTVAYPEDDWASDLKVIDIHPTVGYMVNDKLKVGLGLSVVYSTITLGSPLQVPTGAPMPYQNFYAVGELEGSGIGFGFNLGALYDVTDKLSVGVSYKGPTTIAIDGNVNQTVYHPYNAGIYAQTGDARFLGGTEAASPEATADFPLPQEAGIGFGFKATDAMTIGFDVMWTNWSSVEVVEIDASGDGPYGAPATDSELELNYEDIIRFNVGVDYAVMPDKFNLRLGYYYDPTAIPDESLRPSITDVGTKHNVSIGFAYMLNERMFIEGYWEHLVSAERENEVYYSDESLENLPGTWKMQVDTFGLQFGFRF